MELHKEINPTEMAFIGLHSVHVDSDEDVQLGNGLSLMKPNDFLLSARSRGIMSDHNFREAEAATRYLVYQHPASEHYSGFPIVTAQLNNGLAAMHIIKPVQTLGFIFYGMKSGSSVFNLQRIEYRGSTEAGPWASTRIFDDILLTDVGPMVGKVQRVMEGQAAEIKNAIFLLQLGLEHHHPLISGLLWTMGIEALLGGYGRGDFKRGLSECLGADSLAFPDWSSPALLPPAIKVSSIATDLHAAEQVGTWIGPTQRHN